MIMIRSALALIASTLSVPLMAHDFWIAPDSYRSPGTKADIRTSFRVGTASEVENWNLRRERIVALRSFGPDGVADQQADLEPGQPGFATLRFAVAGSHIVTLESVAVESDLPADEFNDYAAHEGLANVLAWRAQNGQTRANGRETYARRAKAIVQTGKRLTDVTRPLGQSLEIVPLRHPLGLKPGEALPVELRFRGRPLAGARIVIESLSGLAGSNATTITDSAGRASFAIPAKGNWKIATVWSVPITGNPRADFDTLFASLTFGY
jgi:Domain of unknown function (DUF4198)